MPEELPSFIRAISAGFTAIEWGFDAIALAIHRRSRAAEKRAELDNLNAHLDTDKLQHHVAELIRTAGFPPLQEYIDAAYQRYTNECDDAGLVVPHRELRGALLSVAGLLYRNEQLSELPILALASGAIEAARYRDQLLTIGRKLANPAKTAETFTSTVMSSLMALTKRLPHMALSWSDDEPADTAPSVPFLDVLPDAPNIMFEMILPFFHPDIHELGLFAELHKTLLQNQRDASPSNKLLNPPDYKGTPSEIASVFFKNTPFKHLWKARIPFEPPMERRLEHTAIVAGSGHGKTQLLQSIILNDLQQENPPALIVIDSTGAMVQRIQRLALFNDRLAARLLIIDPELDPPPALNMFDMTNERMKGYSGLVREEVETEIIELFNYVFASIAREMTGRQGGAFAYIIRLMLSIPNATVHTLRQLLSDDAKGYEQSKFKAEIEKLDDVGIEFFKTFFYSTSFRSTRAQVLERLLGLLRVPVFNRMFSTVNKLDMYDAMQKGQIVLVNTSARFLKEHASALFGRYIISRTLAAALERAAIYPDDRKPAFLIVDEAAPYFDATFETLLTRVRQFKLGVTVAFQHLEQLDDKLRSAIASNTSIKYAGGLGFTDSRALARDMETTPEFLKARRKTDKQTQFACYVRSYTDTAVSLTVPFGVLESQPRMTNEQHDALLERNRERVTYTEPPKPQPPTEREALPDELAKDLLQVYETQISKKAKPHPEVDEEGPGKNTW